MKKSTLILLEVIAGVIILFALVVGGLTIALQTEWGKKKFTSAIETALTKAPVSVKFDQLSGVLPFLWEIDNVSVTLPSNSQLTIQSLTFRPYFFQLLTGKFSLHSFTARKVSYTPNPSKENETFSADVDLPISLYIKHFVIDSFSLPMQGELVELSLEGKLKASRKGNYLFTDLSVTRPGFDNSKAHIRLRSEKNRLVKLTCKMDAEKSSFFAPLYKTKADAKTSLRLDMRGPFSAFQSLIRDVNSAEKISGKMTGKISDISGADLPVSDELLKESWYFNSDVELSTDRALHLRRLELHNKYLFFAGSLTTDKDFAFNNFRFDLLTHDLNKLSDLFPLPVKGAIHGQILGEKAESGLDMQMTFGAKSIMAQEIYLTSFEAKLTGNYFNDHLTGVANYNTLFYGQRWEGSSKFDYDKGKDLELTDFTIYSHFSDFSGNFTLLPDRYLVGKANFRIDDLSFIQIYFPNISFYGGFEGNATFSIEEEVQKLTLKGDLYDFFYKDLHIEKAKIDSDILNLYNHPIGYLEADLNMLYYQGILIDHLKLTTSTEKESWPFLITADGAWRDPFKFRARGFWHLKKDEFLLNLQSFSGDLFTFPFDLPKPAEISYTPNHLSLSELLITFPESYLKATADLLPKKSKIDIEMDHFPLDFLSLNPLELSIVGYTTAKLSLQEEARQTKASFDMDIEDIEILSINDQYPFWGSGTISVELQDHMATIKSEMAVREEEKVALSGKLPLKLEMMPFIATIDDRRDLSLDLVYNARVEDVLDFINIGPHRLEAEFESDLHLSGKISDLNIEGKATLSNGTYDNYYIGTSLRDINATFTARRSDLIMEKCTGFDTEKGSFTANAAFSINPKKEFPYKVHASFKDLLMVDIPLVIANISGDFKIHGNRKEGAAKGNIKVTNADFLIPEKIPIQIPSLNVTYVGEPAFKKTRKIFAGKKKPYPLELDLKVLAEDQVYIHGRGLASEWRGSFSIGGTYNDILPKGSLNLLKGDFTFAGKSFDLVGGALRFTGESKKAPYLDLSGRTTAAGVSITASLKGFLTGPALTFRSSPSMPLSAILSYLIFGEDISELTVFQAAQLASAAATLTAQGTDIFELTRRTLGLDRFRVISTPGKESTDPEGSALQIGKYIMRGLLVSVSQGPDPASGNVSIEIDLTHGFILEAETIQQQSQGKFGLKWNYNY